MAENLKEMVIVATYISVLDAIVRRKDIDIDDYESRYFLPKHVDSISPHVSNYVKNAISECYTLSDYKVGEEKYFLEHAQNTKILLLDYMSREYSEQGINAVLSALK